MGFILKTLKWQYVGGPLLILLAFGISLRYKQDSFLEKKTSPSSEEIAQTPDERFSEKNKEKTREDKAETLPTVDWAVLQKFDFENFKIGKDTLPQELKPLVNEKIRIPGFAVPLADNFNAIDEFLFVPNQMACIHVPAPPPNLMIFVKLKKPREISEISGPLWLSGVLSLKMVDSVYGQASWEINQDIDIEPYQF